MTSSLRPLRNAGRIGLAIRLTLVGLGLGTSAAHAATVCLVAPNGGDVFVRDVHGARLNETWESYVKARVDNEDLRDSSQRVLYVETPEAAGYVSRAVVKKADACNAARSPDPGSEPTPSPTPIDVTPPTGGRPSPRPPAAPIRPGSLDPFGCGSGSGASKCNRDALQAISTRGKNCADYSTARKIVFFKVDVKESDRGPWIQSVYSNDTLQLSDNRMPDASVFNIEHTFPQSKLKEFPDFGNTKSDMYHLYAIESKINGRRGNMPFCEVSGEPSSQGRVPEFGNNCFEPPEQHKGFVARSMFYMAAAYDLSLDSAQERVLREWNARYPVTAEERERGRRVEAEQGNVNPFIENPEYVNLVSDF